MFKTTTMTMTMMALIENEQIDKALLSELAKK